MSSAMKSKLPPEESLGYQVRGCHRRFDRLLNACLSGHDLKAGYWYYLRVLWMGDGVTQKYLSEMTNVTENTTVALINGMVRDGLVERVRDEEDRRKQRIFLTERGRSLEHELMHYALDINRIATVGIPADELATCVSVLSRMSENLSAELATVPDAAD